MIIAFIGFFLTVLIIDLYGFYGLNILLRSQSLKPFRRRVKIAYWLVDFVFIVFSVIWIMAIRSSDWPDHVQYRNYFYISGTFILIFLPKLVFLIFILINDLKNAFVWIFKKLVPVKRSRRHRKQKVRQSLVLPAMGAVFSVMMFLWVFYGIVYGRFNFRVEQVELYFEDLPESFDGYRLAHFSDTHLGSFARIRPVRRGLQMVSDLDADVVIFSGDLVNNEAAEILPYMEYFEAIQARYGKFTVLGNHDMGDYRRWYTIEEKQVNLLQLEQLQEQMGFSLLRNQHEFISNGVDSIMIVGVDNWGLPPFEQYGDLEEAMGGHAEFPFKLLISHDPTHWRAEVLPQTNIHLMLAGHTHGMQLGIHTRWFSWSPSSFIYPEWYGIYRQGQQVLYVNRGFGFLGLPARLGMPPEITLITLRRTQPMNTELIE